MQEFPESADMWYKHLLLGNGQLAIRAMMVAMLLIYMFQVA